MLCAAGAEPIEQAETRTVTTVSTPATRDVTSRVYRPRLGEVIPAATAPTGIGRLCHQLNAYRQSLRPALACTLGRTSGPSSRVLMGRSLMNGVGASARADWGTTNTRT